jgi:hypothetical protein
VRATRKSGKMEKVGRVHAPTSVEAQRDDWSWMVAADPAFYLEERDGAVAG